MFSPKNTPYTNCLQLIHGVTPSAFSSHDHLLGWCKVLCPHVPVAEAVSVLLRGDPIACPGIHVENVYHVLRVTTRDVPGVAHAPKLELLEPRCSDDGGPPTTFQKEAIAYSHSHWHDELLKDYEWAGCLEFYLKGKKLAFPERSGALVLRNPLEFSDSADEIDRAVFCVIPAGSSLPIHELTAATQSHPNKQWLCGLLCPECRSMHFSSCRTLPNHALQSAWIRSVALNL